ncbi:hypothetical protein AB0M97_00390 [Streptomyces sp. NPDC051207]|uniref:hypothetical protein n=1 Tax=Streptomyces sp. NPDC051207 TaxID=3154641 RepID=UPI003429D389
MRIRGLGTRLALLLAAALGCTGLTAAPSASAAGPADGTARLKAAHEALIRDASRAAPAGCPATGGNAE